MRGEFQKEPRRASEKFCTYCLDKAWRNSIFTSIFLFILVSSYPFVSVAQVRLAWDPNIDSDLMGYKVYYGTGSRSYGPPIDVRNATTFTVLGLTKGVTYYFAVTAYDSYNNESDYSNEVYGSVSQRDLSDLTGQWTSLVQTCRETRMGTKCKISGKLTVLNIGTLNSRSSFVRFYLSDDGNYDEGTDIFLKEIAIGAIKPGKSKTKTLTYGFPLGETATGKFIIAVIDADNMIGEANEKNNYVVSERIP